MKFSNEKIRDMRVGNPIYTKYDTLTKCTFIVSFALDVDVRLGDVIYFSDPKINPKFNIVIDGLKIDMTESIKKLEEALIT